VWAPRVTLFFLHPPTSQTNPHFCFRGEKKLFPFFPIRLLPRQRGNHPGGGAFRGRRLFSPKNRYTKAFRSSTSLTIATKLNFFTNCVTRGRHTWPTQQKIHLNQSPKKDKLQKGPSTKNHFPGWRARGSSMTRPRFWARLGGLGKNRRISLIFL